MELTTKAIGVVLPAVLLAACGNGPAPAGKAVGSIVRLDPALDSLVPKDARIEKVAGGFQFTEGPLWRPDNRLWFSDVIGNVVRSVTPDGQVTVLIEQSGGLSNRPPARTLGRTGWRRTGTGPCCFASTARGASCVSPTTGNWSR
jgi:gluconolactonase